MAVTPTTFDDNRMPADAASDKATAASSVDRWSIATAVVLVIFCLVIVADRAITPQIAVNVDPASYAVVSHELLNGEWLYTDIWDHKPPAPFIVYGIAELIFGYSPQTLLILNLIASLGILAMIYVVGSRSLGGRFAGIVAAGIWAVTCGSFGLEGRDPNTEILINVAVVCAALLIFTGRDAGWSVFRSIAIGFCLLLATMFKPVLVVTAGLLCLAHLVVSADRKMALRDVAVVASVGVTGWAAMFGYFAATGRGRIFYDSMIAYNQHYSGGIISNLIAPLRGNAELMFDVIAPLAAFAAIGLAALIMLDRRKAVFAIALLAGGWFAIAAPGRFSVHYYQMWLPPLIMTAAWGLGSLFANSNKLLRFGGLAGSVLLLFGCVVVQFGEYRQVAAGEFKPVLPVLERSGDTAAKINELLKPDETFFLWGNTPNMYLLADRRPPAAVIFESHLEQNPLYDRLRERVTDDLDRSQPTLLVVEYGRPTVPEWIAEKFDATPIYDDPTGYAIYANRNGRLASKN